MSGNQDQNTARTAREQQKRRDRLRRRRFMDRRRQKRKKPLSSYVKCEICGVKLGQINNNHLRIHGFTVAEYKQVYPHAVILPPDVRKKISVSSATRIFKRKCKTCGKDFETRSAPVFYCPKCQPSISHRRKLRYESLRQPGTFNSKKYLRIIDDRVFGALLLEKRIPSIRPWVSDTRQWLSLQQMILFLHKIYCIECGTEIIIAKANKNYSFIAEPCCPNCGLVYELT